MALQSSICRETR